MALENFFHLLQPTSIGVSPEVLFNLRVILLSSVPQSHLWRCFVTNCIEILLPAYGDYYKLINVVSV